MCCTYRVTISTGFGTELLLYSDVSDRSEEKWSKLGYRSRSTENILQKRIIMVYLMDCNVENMQKIDITYFKKILQI